LEDEKQKRGERSRTTAKTTARRSSELGYQKSGATSLLRNTPKSEFRTVPITKSELPITFLVEG
jgi:hypothetical protein